MSALGFFIALGIIYVDIGTSPLCTMKAIVGENVIDATLVFGGISCVFWTLTLQTKHVILTLQADNNGEGGIFALYTLVRHRGRLLALIAIIGGSAFVISFSLIMLTAVCLAEERYQFHQNPLRL